MAGGKPAVIGGGAPVMARAAANKVGTVRRCPNCNAEIESFQTRCPACNHELNSVQTVDSLQAFFKKLERAENVAEQIGIIELFPVPNSKEDIFEFAILAVSKIKPDAARTNSAWQTKLKQVWLKAQLAFDDDKASLAKLQTIMNEAQKV
jgi:hypothetical protein